MPGHTITYGFAPTGGCGANEAAGANTNRTSQVDNATSTTYCYDDADRLTAYTVEGQGATTLAYDAHGNTTAVGAESYTYDADDRHATTTAGSITVRYTRDANDGVVERTENGVVTGRYSFGAVLDTSGAVLERTIALPGGVILTKRSGGDVWSYPNLRGEVVATADASGAKVGPTRHYSPFGESYQVLPDNARDDFDIAWTGQRFTEHAPGLTDTIEMGARLYSPQLGRFLEVDPVEGGSANDYEYAAGDPYRFRDWTGLAFELFPIDDFTGWTLSGFGIDTPWTFVKFVTPWQMQFEMTINGVTADVSGRLLGFRKRVVHARYTWSAGMYVIQYMWQIESKVQVKGCVLGQCFTQTIWSGGWARSRLPKEYRGYRWQPIVYQTFGRRGQYIYQPRWTWLMYAAGYGR